MNKLEEYRNKKASELASSKASSHDGDFEYGIVMGTESAYQDGFNAAIALNLPVKFLHWIDYYTVSQSGYEPHRIISNPIDKIYRGRNYDELYQYWINNIYKPE